MPEPNYGAAAQQTMLMLQKVNKDVQLVESLDTGLDKMFSSVGPGDEIGLQNYRLPLQMEVGGIGGYYNPDGGTYPQGAAAQYDQMILAPQPIILAFTVTELARRISKAGMDVTVKNWVAKMIADAKKKASHFRNAYLQGYNNGLLATIDSTYVGGSTTVPLAYDPFGGRLINRGDQLLVTDANFNVQATVNILDITKNAIGTPDVMTVDAIPGGAVAGWQFIPFGLASGNPIGINGLQYLVSPAITGELCGIARANSYVQAPAWNANSAFLTNAGVEIFLARMEQALGADRFAAGVANNAWYGHQAQWTSVNILGFGKMVYFSQDGKTPTFDIATSTKSVRMLAGRPFVSDSMASISALYFLDKSTLKRVRYPDSEKFLPGPLEGMFWPRQSGGLWSSQSDILYQDSTNYAVNNPWANGVLYGLKIQPGFSN
jgi:hypothetical protein